MTDAEVLLPPRAHVFHVIYHVREVPFIEIRCEALVFAANTLWAVAVIEGDHPGAQMRWQPVGLDACREILLCRAFIRRVP